MFRRLATGLPVTDCLEELNAFPILWNLFTARQETEGSPHRDTESIILRGPAIPDIDSAFNDINAYDYPVVNRLPKTRELISHVCNTYLPGYMLGRVMVAKLLPFGHITKHADEGAYAEHYERFHVVLASEDGNRFANGIAQVCMRPGTLWSFEHRKEHEVWNGSNAPRIHIIIDARKTGAK
jgi:hypothetical protein